MKKFIIMCAISIFSFSYMFQEAKADTGKGSLTITQAKDFSKASNNRKKIFIDTLLPIIDTITEQIKEDKTRVEDILTKETTERTLEEKVLLEQNYTKYKVGTKTPQELLKKMVIPPTSLILAQASVESGWGLSKLSQLGNNLFGMTSPSKDADKSIKMGGVRYKKYDTIYSSVEDYILTLSRHSAYKNLRGGIRRGEDSVTLVKHLGSYSELGKKYGNYVAGVIKNNSLQEHDNDDDGEI